VDLAKKVLKPGRVAKKALTSLIKLADCAKAKCITINKKQIIANWLTLTLSTV
jgi:hypothetical protein